MVLLGCCLGAAWVLLRRRLGDARALLACCLGAAWVLLGCPLGAASVVLRRCFGAARARTNSCVRAILIHVMNAIERPSAATTAHKSHARALDARTKTGARMERTSVRFASRHDNIRPIRARRC
eukprot:800110-Lingulodinium_polyedra.AAC.1